MKDKIYDHNGKEVKQTNLGTIRVEKSYQPRLKLLAIQQNKTMIEMGNEALEDLFKKYSKKQKVRRLKNGL